MYKSFRYRIYPTEAQQILFNKTFGCVRFIYNKMLEDKLEYYRKYKRNLHNTPAQYKSEFPWLKEVDSIALGFAQLHLNSAFNNFFKNPAKFHRPQFKRKNLHIFSYSTFNHKGTVRIEGNKLKLPKVGWVKIKYHRPIIEGAVIKSATITKSRSGKFYASVLTEYENEVLPVIPHRYLGLDFTMTGLYTSSDEGNANYPGFYKMAEEKLAWEQRKLSRKKKGGRNWDKQRIRVARAYERVSNQRHDFLQKCSTRLAENYDVIGVESISVKNIGRKRKAFHFGKSIGDNGWCYFVKSLENKLKWQGKRLIKVAWTYPSSQLCHVCGYRNRGTLDLSLREWTCPRCGTHHQRDINAAINIREEAKRLSEL